MKSETTVANSTGLSTFPSDGQEMKGVSVTKMKQAWLIILKSMC